MTNTINQHWQQKNRRKKDRPLLVAENGQGECLPAAANG